MAKAARGKLLEKISEVSQEIDLAYYLKRKPTEQDKRLFSEAAIEVIKSRTLNGSDFNGRKFKNYTKEYADKKGVSVSSVDLFLEGDMLDSISRKKRDEKSDTVKIGITGDLQNAKSFNHQTGDTLPKRKFFGISSDEAESIAQQIGVGKSERITLKDLIDAASSIGITQET